MNRSEESQVRKVLEKMNRNHDRKTQRKREWLGRKGIVCNKKTKQINKNSNKKSRATEEDKNVAREERGRSGLRVAPLPNSQFSGAELQTTQPVSQLSFCFPLVLCLARI